jgi:phosphonate transport system substrate-binding protein
MKKIIVFISMMLVIAMSTTACSGTKETSKKEVLNVALLPDESPAEVIKNNEKLKEYLSETLDMEINLIVTTDYSSMIEGMRKGHIDIGYFGPLSYVLLKQKMENVEPFAAKLENGKPTYRGVVIGNVAAGVKQLSDIEGKTMAYGDVASTSSHLIPKELLLTKAGLKAGEDYEEQFLGAHDAVAIAVQNGNPQAGGLSKPIYEKLIEEGMIDENKVQVIDESDDYPNYPWAICTDLDQDLQEKIKNAFYNLDDEEILESLKAEGFAKIEDSDYDIIRNMVELLDVDLEDM